MTTGKDKDFKRMKIRGRERVFRGLHFLTKIKGEFIRNILVKDILWNHSLRSSCKIFVKIGRVTCGLIDFGL